ncbi:S-adenosyl-L-methionine-dependent methyltransferase [Pseudovirgaria hyperparasitica]|uniref:S-adenosyl-L-methionine-dependent methyltransferase n=1 Tax=Pseudovirgaria hyperparasitica TaxID=470096 RepID=A0A6A6W7Z8_9PEZI|nr:S-adenosyl-L-methionine-dependent methyltransferase [Pseudovirgaria hyperparasitica]KAF2757707.1 S-adenosyl-L-methionine-dependent methyltransferase [Pseudovirgaria hyperparasitica]
MGRHRGKGRRQGGRNGGGGGAGGGSRDNQPGGWPEIERSNKDYEQYYNEEVNILPESERDAFWKSLRTTLPNSFRFTGSKGHALTVQKVLVDRYIPQISAVEFEGEGVEPPTQIPWYPNQLAWHMTTGKQVIRKSPPFAFFQKFLVSETSVGNISRQEVVSMIPPLVMDIGPGMTVLDLCAAPGSKSAQLAEMIHAGEEARVRKVFKKIAKEEGREVSPDGEELKIDQEEVELEDDMSDDGRSTGLLIANEIDWRRAQMLVHQIKRLNSPNFIVTNHDARMFPSIITKAEPGKPREYLKFDRILADVPCTGDGTTRKNVSVWKDWTRQNALGLYATQVQILVRALQMLKVGGRVVYSTCSMNPIENEAVVASAIDKCGGSAAVTVVNCEDRMAGLKRRPGLSNWPVVDRLGRKFKTWNEAEEFKKENNDEAMGRLSEGMFAPDASEEIQLQNCMRVYPHLQDSGGFFITVLEKTAEIRKLRDPPSKRVKGTNGTAMEESVTKGTVVDAEPSIPTSPEIAATEAENGTNGGVSLPKDLPEPAIEPPNENSVTSPKRSLEDDENEQSAKRLKQDKATTTTTPAATTTKPPAQKQNISQQKKRAAPKEEPFKYLSPDHPVLADISKFYGLSSRFPRDRFMVRNENGDPVKAIYYTSALTRQILMLNEGSGMKFVHSGVKMFVKQDAPSPEVCKWRIQSEGLPILDSWVGEDRIVRLYTRKPLHRLLRETFVKVNQDNEELGEIAERLRDIPMGCAVLRVEVSGDPENGFADRMVMPLWRSVFSLQLMLPKEDRKAMLLRLFNDDSPLIDHNKEKGINKSKKQLAEEAAAAAAQEEEMKEEEEEVEEAEEAEELVQEEELGEANKAATEDVEMAQAS